MARPVEVIPKGTLTLIGTPIGNLGDLPAGALEALRSADVLCAEDTRRTRKLLSAYGVHPARLVSIRAHNERREAARVLGWLAEGKRVGYVTDAGMPTVSDPGQELVRAVLDAGGSVAVAPGPDAVTTALALSGFPVERWCFEGFLPVKGAERAARLVAVAAEPRTVVFFEAPHRLLRTLENLAESAGGHRGIAVLSELTKRFERVFRGTVATAADQFRQSPPRGEFVLVLAPPDAR